MNEHDPIYAEVYAAPKIGPQGQAPVRPTVNPKPPGPKFLRDPMGIPDSKDITPKASPRPDGVITQVQAAALAEASPSSRGRSPRMDPIPIYEVHK